MVEYEKPKDKDRGKDGRWKALMSRTKRLYDRVWGNREERELKDGGE